MLAVEQKEGLLDALVTHSLRVDVFILLIIVEVEEESTVKASIKNS